jgi:hypothetical protein
MPPLLPNERLGEKCCGYQSTPLGCTGGFWESFEFFLPANSAKKIEFLSATTGNPGSKLLRPTSPKSFIPEERVQEEKGAACIYWLPGTTVSGIISIDTGNCLDQS